MWNNINDLIPFLNVFDKFVYEIDRLSYFNERNQTGNKNYIKGKYLFNIHVC